MEDHKEPQQPQPPILDQLKEYGETRLKLAKYQAVEGGSSILAGMIADVVVVICIAFAFIFASITLAFYLAYVIASYWMGFGCVAIIYVLIALIVKYNRKRIDTPLINIIIQKILK